MSGFHAIAAIPIPPTAFPTLILILGQLGFEVFRGVREIRCAGKVQAKSSIFRSANGVEVEITLDEEGKVQVCVDEAELRAKEGIEREELAGKIVQGYTYHKVIEELQAKGFTIVEEQELDTGTVRLVVRKWS